MTLGEAFDAGRITSSEEELETLHGPGWRGLQLSDIADRIDALTVQEAQDDQELAGLHERMRITEVFIAKVETGRATDDDLIAEVVQELYGAEPPQASVDAVLDVVADLERLKRGEEPE